MSKNAIFCAEDLFLKCGPELNLSQKACDALAGALLDTCASNMPKALRTAAATALEQGVTTGPLMKLIPALAVKANAKNADVAEAAMVFAEKACKAVSAQVRNNRGGCRSYRDRPLSCYYCFMNKNHSRCFRVHALVL